MHEGPENLYDENEAVAPAIIDAAPAESQDFEGAFSKFEMPTSYIINGVEMGVEDLRALAIPEIANDSEVMNFSPEDKKIFGELLFETAEVAHIARSPEAPHEAQVAALGNAFFATPEEALQTKEAQEIVGVADESASFAEKVNTTWKKWISLAALAIGASILPQAASAGNIFNQATTRVEREMDRGVIRGSTKAGRQAGKIIEKSIEGAVAQILNPVDEMRRQAGFETPQEIRKRESLERREQQRIQREIQKQERAIQKSIAQVARDPNSAQIVETREQRQTLELEQLDKEWQEKIEAVSLEDGGKLKIEWLNARENMLREHQKQDRQR